MVYCVLGTEDHKSRWNDGPPLADLISSIVLQSAHEGESTPEIGPRSRLHRNSCTRMPQAGDSAPMVTLLEILSRCMSRNGRR
jgi:hypothetical protein